MGGRLWCSLFGHAWTLTATHRNGRRRACRRCGLYRHGRL